MSDKCGNCDCADKSQCVKKGNAYGIDIVETGKSYIETVVMEAPGAGEHEASASVAPAALA